VPTNSSHQNLFQKPIYRKDIDGLRAIAVILVIFSHYFPTLLNSGFIGVDIFFVLSGYLIGEILLREMHSGTFSFKDFYSRRILRILPALLTLLASVYLFGYGSLVADQFANLGTQIKATSAFILNFFLIKEAGYFDVASAGKILLNLWSLCIEEQFYFFWPLILWIAYKKRWNLFLVYSLFLFGSFFSSVFETDSTFRYYSITTRMWELMAGGLYAGIKNNYFNFKLNYNIKSKIEKSSGNYIALASFAIILFASGLLEFRDSYRAIDALIPVICTILLLNCQESWFNKVVLSNPLMVSVGLISYPLYLWHWPILSFHYNIRRIENYGESLTLLLITIILSVITYIFVEKPIRFSPEKKRNSAILLTVLVFVGTGGFVTEIYKGIPGRYDGDDINVTRVWNYNGINVTDCRDLFKGISDPICATTPNPNVALFGDSHAAHYFQGFLQQKNSRFNQVLTIGAGNCQPFSASGQREGCDQSYKIALDYILKTKSINTVFIAGFYGISFNKYENEEVSKKLQDTVDAISRVGKKVVVLEDVPALKKSADLCYSPKLFLLNMLRVTPEFCYGSLPAQRKDQSRYRTMMETIKSARKDILFYDPYQALCDRDICKVTNDGKILYSDDNHLSNHGAKFIVDDILKRYDLN
jgi:peptidoglycan/LPS O-acetylase OafA/YrhL